MRRRTLIIIGVLGVVLLVFLILHPHKQSNGPKLGPVITGCTGPIPTAGAVIAVLRSTNHAATATTYNITDIKEPHGCWDVVKLTVQGGVETQTALFQRVGKSMYLSAGPSTSFPKSLMLQLNVPTDVQSSLVVYDDTNPAGSSELGQ